jgi:predicted Zn-dependent protease
MPMAQRFVTRSLAGILALISLSSCQHLSRGQDVAEVRWPHVEQILMIQKQRLEADPLHASEDLQRYVQRVGQYVSLHLEMSGPNLRCAADRERQWPRAGFRFVVVHSKRSDLSVFPEGTIWISSSLLQELKSEDALAGWVAQAATQVVCGAGQWSKEQGQLNFSPEEIRVADRGATLALYRAGYWLPEYAASLLKAGYVEREQSVQRDWLRIQAQRQIKNTREQRAHRYQEALKQL